MPRAVRIFVVVLAVAGLAASASFARTTHGTVGVGLKLGKVVNTIPVGSSIGPWLVWNKSTCSYQQAASHPKNYVEIRELLQPLAGNKNSPDYALTVYHLGLAIRGQGITDIATAEAKPPECAALLANQSPIAHINSFKRCNMVTSPLR